MKLNFNPVTKEEIHQLEIALLVGTLFRKEVLEEIRNSAERLTWVDSLAVAAGALARAKAGMTASEIAEELGRTEATIREHVKGETKAGKLVNETYELLKEGKLSVEGLIGEGIKVVTTTTTGSDEKLQEVKKELEEIKQKLESVIQKL
ncbi:transcriptional regulators-like protein [Thermotoga petrophila RKU-1]|uniref:Transcriptional regulators-like protein n=1 Tax=Thermotoga petrophila (strain ATCC BAA-488 / DSM 13995 / JCM 10881 / RKU-1) TaxID=390874 RepID=A5IK46_THEP1|nr:transcriptional regulator [Thermotoga petrophila]ABQ46569.1 transcriptional regulators-like protein [Thermotoga petrophila RKU-1]